MLCGAVLPLLAAVAYIAGDSSVAVPVLGAVLGLAGLAAFEWAWIGAGQVVSLS